MANLCTKIEIYLGRTPDFSNEVQVFGDGGVQTINLWNCTDKPEPKESDLCSDEEADYFDGMRFLRQERDTKLKKGNFTRISTASKQFIKKKKRESRTVSFRGKLL